jgi:ketosteroid isomerase-like protein
VIDELRAAVEALDRGDVEPFVALLDENSEWRGITRGRLWWKHTPS